jgi:hypothetical protein
MRITIHAPGDGASQAKNDGEFQRAFVVLHRADIQSRGGGRFADSSIAIILTREADGRHKLLAAVYSVARNRRPFVPRLSQQIEV